MAIDPGATTGFALYDDNSYYVHQIDLVDPKPHKALYDYISNKSPKIIIYEAFLHRQGQTGISYKPVEYIGVIILWCQQNDIPFCSINPSHGKAFWTNEKLKTLNFYTPGLLHGMDAMRVLFTYLSKTKAGWMNEMVEKLRDK